MTKIYIQGNKGSYSFEASQNIQKKIKTNFETKFCKNFEETFDKIKKYKLGGFATNNINLTKLESRPCSKNPFKYSFYVDFLGKLEDINIKNSLDELKFFSNKIQILGEYEKFI